MTMSACRCLARGTCWNCESTRPSARAMKASCSWRVEPTAVERVMSAASGPLKSSIMKRCSSGLSSMAKQTSPVWLSSASGCTGGASLLPPMEDVRALPPLHMASSIASIVCCSRSSMPLMCASVKLALELSTYCSSRVAPMARHWPMSKCSSPGMACSASVSKSLNKFCTVASAWIRNSSTISPRAFSAISCQTKSLKSTSSTSLKELTTLLPSAPSAGSSPCCVSAAPCDISSRSSVSRCSSLDMTPSAPASMYSRIALRETFAERIRMIPS
mmetsp:Transcript_4735/g.10761  ORF Transcript_4735/g.10761 Transcript_4735/m.10761 type:complete len:274 (+) Transcript_4735:978-1799(+)